MYLLGTTADTATATHAAVTITYAAQAKYKNAIAGIALSYSGGTLSGGNVKIKDGTNVIFDLDITTAGPLVINFAPLKSGSKNTALNIVLADGGASVVGKLNILGATTVL